MLINSLGSLRVFAGTNLYSSQTWQRSGTLLI